MSLGITRGLSGFVANLLLLVFMDLILISCSLLLFCVSSPKYFEEAPLKLRSSERGSKEDSLCRSLLQASSRTIACPLSHWNFSWQQVKGFAWCVILLYLSRAELWSRFCCNGIEDKQESLSRHTWMRNLGDVVGLKEKSILWDLLFDWNRTFTVMFIIQNSR